MTSKIMQSSGKVVGVFTSVSSRKGNHSSGEESTSVATITGSPAIAGVDKGSKSHLGKTKRKGAMR